MGKIKEAFPTLPIEFYNILCERLKEKKFTVVQITEAVNGVIDTCKYPTPTIAHFIGYIEENSCPFNFSFGKDHKNYEGCNTCEMYDIKTWWHCKVTQMKNR